MRDGPHAALPRLHRPSPAPGLFLLRFRLLLVAPGLALAAFGLTPLPRAGAFTSLGPYRSRPRPLPGPELRADVGAPRALDQTDPDTDTSIRTARGLVGAFKVRISSVGR